MAEIVQRQQVQLRAVETFIKDYKKLTHEDLRNLERCSYEDFLKRLRTDPVKLMVEAADVGMDISQYGNLISPVTRVEQGRSIMHRVMEDEGIYPRETDMSAPTVVEECLDGGHRQAILFHILTKVWDRNSIRDRNSLQLESSSPIGNAQNPTSYSQPQPIPLGLRFNPGELVATSHSINTNSYSPFRWEYEKEDMQRNRVRPGQTIPASTLAESEGNIQMNKWGNRFVIPYEMLTGGQGMRLNKLANMVALDASTESVRQFEELIGVYRNGDGAQKNDDDSDPTAPVVEGISGYQSTGNATTFSFTAFLNWLDEALTTPFQISHVLMMKEQQRELRAALAALQGNLAMAQLSSVGLAPNTMSNMDAMGNIRYGRVPDGVLGSGQVMGIDARYGMEKVNRAGMTIRQQAENIANQTRDVVISDTYLWARLAREAVKILHVGS